jgi:chromosome segregation ATPase
LIANPDVKKIISDLLKLQSEIDACEREKFNLELFLSDLETDFKLLIKRGPSPQNAGEKRSQIEQKRNELNNSTSQISILKKRKQILYDEMKSFELVEKRRYETGVEIEKNLVETKKELNELKSQRQGLENITTNLKETVKNISKEKQ